MVKKIALDLGGKALKKLVGWFLFLFFLFALLLCLSLIEKMRTDMVAVTDKAVKDIEALFPKPDEKPPTEVSTKP